MVRDAITSLSVVKLQRMKQVTEEIKTQMQYHYYRKNAYAVRNNDRKNRNIA